MPTPPRSLRRLFKGKDASKEPAASPQGSVDDEAVAKARDYLEQVPQKMERLAEDFASGKVNTTQFQELYAHYQQERRIVEQTLEETPEAAAWRATVAKEEGESAIIRRRHAARILGYAIYLNTTTLPLRTVGKYDIDARLVASMLDSFRTHAEEQPEQQMRGIEIGESRWVGFVPGQYTTLMVLFSVEPARTQLDMLRDLQAHFERANQQLLVRGIVDPARLVFPHAAVFE
jgi:hypothetical protein